MKTHPQQYNFKVVDGLSEIFRNRMLELGILPRNAKKAKRVQKWLNEMGARMTPKYEGLWPVVSNWRPDTENFLNFQIKCKEGESQHFAGIMLETKNPWYMEIEIPWEVADKVLLLGYIP